MNGLNCIGKRLNLCAYRVGWRWMPGDGRRLSNECGNASMTRQWDAARLAVINREDVY